MTEASEKHKQIDIQNMDCIFFPWYTHNKSTAYEISCTYSQMH